MSFDSPLYKNRQAVFTCMTKYPRNFFLIALIVSADFNTINLHCQQYLYKQQIIFKTKKILVDCNVIVVFQFQLRCSFFNKVFGCT